MNLTRRDFLKLCGIGTAACGMGARFSDLPLQTPAPAAPVSPHTGFGVLIDTTRCLGCKQCQVACQQAHHLPADAKANVLCATALSIVDMHNVSPDLSKPEIRPIKRQCMHCLNPACAAACTVGALRKTPEGPVVYDAERCIGCRYCMYACPFGIPTFEWNQTFSLIKKCDGCAEMVCQGEMPVCVKACPAGALTYGNRAELLAVAKERIYTGKGKYLDKIYGEHDVGGTSMLYLASTPFEQLGLPILPEESPAELNMLIMHSAPTIAVTMALLLSGIYWMIKRRDRLESEPWNGGYQPVKRKEES